MCAHLSGELPPLLRDLDSFALSSGQLNTEKLLQLSHLSAVESLFRGITTRSPRNSSGLRDSTEVKIFRRRSAMQCALKVSRVLSKPKGASRSKGLLSKKSLPGRNTSLKSAGLNLRRLNCVMRPNSSRIQPGMTHAEAAMPVGKIRGMGGVPNGFVLPGYSPTALPVFFGHWLDPKAIKAPLALNVACVDYSAGYGGPLVAYRFDGERVLNRDKFVTVK